MKVYRLKVKCGRYWLLGRIEYKTMDEALKRMFEMKDVGIRTRLCDFYGKEVKTNEVVA